MNAPSTDFVYFLNSYSFGVFGAGPTVNAPHSLSTERYKAKLVSWASHARVSV